MCTTICMYTTISKCSCIHKKQTKKTAICMYTTTCMYTTVFMYTSTFMYIQSLKTLSQSSRADHITNVYIFIQLHTFVQLYICIYTLTEDAVAVVQARPSYILWLYLYNYIDVYCYIYMYTSIFMWIQLLQSSSALRSPEKRLPSGALKKEFGRMNFENRSSLGDRTKVQSPPSAAACGGEAWRRNVWHPCMLDHDCSSASL